MALRLVLFQQRLYLQPQSAVIQRQPFTDILMHGGLADSELLCGGAYRRFVLYQVKGQLLGPLFQILSNRAPLPCRYCPMYMMPRRKIYRSSITRPTGMIFSQNFLRPVSIFRSATYG